MTFEKTDINEMMEELTEKLNGAVPKKELIKKKWKLGMSK